MPASECDIRFISGSHGYLLYVDVATHEGNVVPFRIFNFGRGDCRVLGVFIDKDQATTAPLFDSAAEGTPINVYTGNDCSHHGSIVSFGELSINDKPRGVVIHFLEEKLVINGKEIVPNKARQQLSP